MGVESSFTEETPGYITNKSQNAQDILDGTCDWMKEKCKYFSHYYKII